MASTRDGKKLLTFVHFGNYLSRVINLLKMDELIVIV